MPHNEMAIVASNPDSVLSNSASEATSWQRAMKHAVRDVRTLCRLLDLPEDSAPICADAAADFPLFVPRGYISRIRPGDPDDPLLRQVWPRPDEAQSVVGFNGDPVDDARAELRPGLLVKYAGRALLVTTGACAVHCRYCFRRHFPYPQVPKSLADWQPSLQAIAADPSIDEVILSGGDPLTLTDSHLANLVQSLEAIGNVKRLRIHTRLPVMIPERVTAQLLDWLTTTRLTPIMVIHANHAAELDASVATSLSRLTQAQVMLLNQAVLLRGVNDTIEAQVDLSRRLVELRVIPYYLHQLDRVAGAAHFEVPVSEGKRLMAAVRAQLSGYAVPRYVQEIPGEPNKRVLA